MAAQISRRNSGDQQRYDDLLLDIVTALDQADLVGDAGGPPAFAPLPQFMAGANLVRNDLVEHLLERRHLYLLAAHLKAGKTLAAMNLAVAVSRGKPWLGRETGQGPVFMLQLEDSERTLGTRWRAMSGDDGIPPNISLSCGPWRLGVDNVESTINALSGASLVVVDPIISAAGIEQWNDMAEVRAAYDLWRQIARETGATVLVVAHHRKAVAEDGDQVAGSHQAGAVVDGIIELRRDKRRLESNERSLSFIGRDWPDLGDEVIALDQGTLTFHTVGPLADRKAAQDEVKALADAELVLEELRGESALSTELRDEKLSWSGVRYNRAVELGVSAGLFHKQKRGRHVLISPGKTAGQ